MVELDQAARTWLADAGYDPVYGARPLKRVIQRNVQDPLAELILQGRVADGETVKVSAGAEGLIVAGHEVARDGSLRDKGEPGLRVVH